ncbi:MAG: DUF4347 domain-containing protein [Burkholderiaceae bacterium]
MNRTFRSIWNPSLDTFVAVAETQVSRGRSVSGTRAARRQACRSSVPPLALEPRIVFDAALVATVVDVQGESGDAADTLDVVTADGVEVVEVVDGEGASPGTLTGAEAEAGPDAVATEEGAGREIIFVDPVASSLDEHLQDSGAEIIYLDADRDGVEQIAEALQDQTDITAIHIVSHGVEGRLMLGNTVLDAASMQAQHQQALQDIGAALSEEGDILIYGCNFSAGENGLAAATLLSEITGADVAASADTTGHVDNDGNWTLETRIGHVEALALAPSDWVGTLDLVVQNVGTVGTDALASAIMGPGVTIDSAIYYGGLNQAGVFSTGAGISFGSDVLEFTEGAIFTTNSNTTSVAGPNNNAELSSDALYGVDGDADFNAASGGFDTFDASYIVINFTPDVFPGGSAGDTGRMTASLVFGSEEYNEYVYSGFNDTIGVWVNGVNVALAPNGLAIGIDTINDAESFNPSQGSPTNDPNPGHSTTSYTSANPNLYVNNSTSTYNAQMDGFTVTISLTFDVTVGQQNTIKLGIADTGDTQLDSWLFIKAESLQTAFVPENDSVSTPANVPASVDLTANDFNFNGGALDIIAINGAALAPGGSVVLDSGVTVTLDSGGTVTVTGDGVNAVTDTFTYTVQNQDGQTGNAIVSVNITAPVVNRAPVAVNDGFSTGEDAASAVIGNVLGNDSDPDGDSLVVAAQSGVAGSNGGLFGIDAAGQVTFDPNGAFEGLGAGQTATTSFTYTLSDGQGGSDTAMVTVTVTGANDAPVAVDDGLFEVTPGRAVTGHVLGNDSDVDGDVLAVTAFAVDTGRDRVAETFLAGQVALIRGVGTLTVLADGSFVFVPAEGYAGPVPEATYTVSDGLAQTSASILFGSVPEVPVPPAPVAPPPAPEPEPAPAPSPELVNAPVSEAGGQWAAAPVAPSSVASGSLSPALHVLYAVSRANLEGQLATSGLALGTSTPLISEAMAQAPEGLLFEGMAEASAAALVAADGLSAGAPALHVQHAVRHEPVASEPGSYVQRAVRSAQVESRLGDAILRSRAEIQSADEMLDDLLRAPVTMRHMAGDAPAGGAAEQGQQDVPADEPEDLGRRPSELLAPDIPEGEGHRSIDSDTPVEPDHAATGRPDRGTVAAPGFRAQLAGMAQARNGWGRPLTRSVAAA